MKKPVLIIAILVLIGLFFFMKQRAESRMIDFSVDISCAFAKAVQESGIKNMNTLAGKTFDQYKSENPEFYEFLEPKLYTIMTKYNLTYEDLLKKQNSMRILMQTNPSFKKKVAYFYLKKMGVCTIGFESF